MPSFPSFSPRPYLPPLTTATPATTATTLRPFSQCSCPGVSESAPRTVMITYPPGAVDAFIALADALEDERPYLVVEGVEGEAEGNRDGPTHAGLTARLVDAGAGVDVELPLEDGWTHREVLVAVGRAEVAAGLGEGKGAGGP